ncbi:unnamed protein product [Lampetra fluviatilis]
MSEDAGLGLLREGIGVERSEEDALESPPTSHEQINKYHSCLRTLVSCSPLKLGVLGGWEGGHTWIRWTSNGAERRVRSRKSRAHPCRRVSMRRAAE